MNELIKLSAKDRSAYVDPAFIAAIEEGKTSNGPRSPTVLVTLKNGRMYEVNDPFEYLASQVNNALTSRWSKDYELNSRG